MGDTQLPVHSYKNIILTNAAGGINPNLKPGDLIFCERVKRLSIINVVVYFPNKKCLSSCKDLLAVAQSLHAQYIFLNRNDAKSKIKNAE